MKSYVKVYLDYFDYTVDDYISCECCNKQRAADIHHILSRKRRPDLIDDITNLMALCRECHIKYGDNNKYLDLLIKRHNKILNK